MVRHAKCHGVADVDKFMNESGLTLDKVQIVYGLAKFGGDYYVFYDDGKPLPEKKRKAPETTVEADGELQLVPMDRKG